MFGFFPLLLSSLSAAAESPSWRPRPMLHRLRGKTSLLPRERTHT